ncbi:MAG: porin [Bacteroidia bacterium]|nr:porin [Bacteroidia bacterium]
MKVKKVIICFIFLMYSAGTAFAQGEDTLSTVITGMQTNLRNLNKLKFTGYIQSQVQFSDSNGISSYAGGNFPSNVDKRFTVRRGRLKATYSGNPFNLFVIQIDVTQSGVGIKDAYARFSDPWARAFHLTTGVFDRPFGYEISYSSSSRETPERGRMSQIVFPGERDLGAMITFQMPKEHPFSYFRIDAGMFNGTGGTAVDFDFQKDFIGRMRIDRTSGSEKFKYGMGVSYYKGGRRMANSTIWSAGTDSLGLNTFTQEPDTNNYGKIAPRQHFGADFQFSVDWPAGLTTIRGEYVQGNMPGTSSSSGGSATQPTGDTYQRNFNGAYFYFVQKILQTRHEIVVKYDWYDPNTDVSGDEIGKSAQGPNAYKTTGKTDLRYSTLGLGYIFHYDSNVKLVFYRDMVTNETSSNLSGFTKDITDDVWTFRVQFKF